MGRAALRIAFFVCAFGAWALPGLALDPQRQLTQYALRVWTVEQGLPQNSVLAILQTREGHIWLGTQEGLVRFDGVRFSVFDGKNTPAFRDQHVLVLFEDSGQNLWIGTRGGGLLRHKDGVFTRFDAADGLPSGVVRSIYEDRGGRLWVGTDAGVVQMQGGRFAAPPGLTRAYVVMAIAEAEGALWLGTDGDGLLRVRPEGVETFTRSQGLSSDEVRALHTGKDGTLWIGTRGGLDRLTSRHIAHVPSPSGAWEAVAAIHEDVDGSLWVGTRGQGIARLAAGRWSALRQKDGLAGDIVYALHEDREGSLWIGTEGTGLNRLRDVKIAPFGKPEGLAHEMIGAILEDRGGALWLASYGGGLHRYRHGEFRAYTTQAGLSSNLVFSLFEDREGSLWVGTDGGGLNRLRDGTFTSYRTRDGLPNDRVWAVAEDREGGLWVGTFRGLARLKDGQFTRFGPEQGLSSEIILALTVDHAGRLWVGTDGGGLNVLEGGRFTAYTTDQGLAHNTVYRVHEDEDGTLWIGTAGGLSRFRNGTLAKASQKDGLFEDGIYQVLEDNGRLWMSGNKGIFRVDKKDLEDLMDGRAKSVASVAFGTADGMRTSECNGGAQPAGWKASDGSLWFPTTRGAVRIDPARMRTNAVAPPVAIEEVTIDRQSYDPHVDLTVPPGRGEIEIHYTGLSFLEPEKVRFRYQLEGFDPAWVESGTRRVAYYTNIPPGPYRFHVAAANNEGVWNEEGAVFAFTLRSHFYQARWFFALCVLGTVLLAAAAYQVRMRQLARTEQKLAGLVSERTQELQKANEILSRFSFLDALTGIPNRRNFDASLDLEWRRVRRAGVPLALIMIDIDFFKAYNDTYGHPRGDECLRLVAQTLQRTLHRPGDVCTRYGGEEFAAILPGTDAAGAVAVAEGLRASIEHLAVPHPGSSKQVVTISLGVSVALPGDETTPESLLECADRALYDAKRSGRNLVRVPSAYQAEKSAST